MKQKSAISGFLKALISLAAAGAGAGIAMLLRLALKMPFWKPAPVLLIGIVVGLFVYLAIQLGMKKLLSLDVIRGALCGLAGTGIGVSLTVLVRWAMGLPPWEPNAVLSTGIFSGVISYLATVGVFRYWARWAMGAKEQSWTPRHGWERYFSVDFNHKVIGIQYALTGLIFLPFAVALQLIGRTHMADPNLHLLTITTYESVISDHGIVMLFIVVLPVFSGLMNYFVPLQIGSRDVAFPHLNAFTYWLIPPAGLLTAFSLMTGGFDTGWTVYPPLAAGSFEPPGVNLILIGVFLSGLSSILTGVNILTTTFKLRAPGMSYFRMPVFIWSTLATTGLTLIFTQFIALAFLLVLLQRVFGMGFFDPAQGGQPLLYQYLFWFYSHPAVYVFVLIGLGLISDIIPVFVRKPLFGYKGVALASPGIALGGTVVFAHHMFAAGMPGWMRLPFMITTLLVAVPTGVKVFAWVATTWMGKMRLATPMLFVLTSIVLFLIGGLTGIPLGIVPVDLYLHDTYFVVGHFHAMLFGGFLIPVMAGIYYWYPKVTGRMLAEKPGRIQWLLMTLGAFLLVIPMLGLGLEGMRRRIADYPMGLGFQPMHILTAVGGFLVFAGLVVLAYNAVASFKRGVPAGNNPWGARTLEWMVTSPPPEDNFTEIPQVLDSPHLAGVSGSVHAEMKSVPKKQNNKNQNKSEEL